MCLAHLLSPSHMCADVYICAPCIHHHLKHKLNGYFVTKRIFSFKSMSHLYLPLYSEIILQCVTYVVTLEEMLSSKASSASGLLCAAGLGYPTLQSNQPHLHPCFSPNTIPQAFPQEASNETRNSAKTFI